MNSFNAVLQKFFNLPPAMRMLLAVAGFGSLASIVYFFLPALGTRQGKIWILIIAGIGLLVALLILGVRRLLVGRKSARLNGALASQGPTRGDIAEQEQAYCEKFRNKLAELKTNGLSVYRLPWFVLIGEPGCGKTASLIHSGLDFPLGKDEVPGFGGTRNYNWWFTNDAVILDTAGRISFHEEGTTDRVEWEYFLKLLRQNRPRCPINGVIVAVPADKLLRDSPDERAQKATILRERLRQVHQTLGVRFPTFFLVTKMDLVGGFSEFFEEVRVDLQQRNQMFGWSRPGEFQQPFNPTDFADAFDQVYFRLRDWSLRYLQRKATEEELGLVVTFPEAFRQLRGPLGDYIGTIFQKSPLLEPPFFRGFYFTSAVQEGAPIFDVFSRSRAGVMLPERPTKAVDSKAFFIHDLYERKVFAEHGLIFRSAQHVTLNQRMRRTVWAGSAVLVILMMALFAFGALGVRHLVTQPKNDCHEAISRMGAAPARTPEEFAKNLASNLSLATRLQEHYQRYEGWGPRLRARAMFIGANLAVPREAVREIHSRFVVHNILRPIVSEAERRLADKATLDDKSRQLYVAALAVYARWYGELIGGPPAEPATSADRDDQIRTLLDFLGLDSSDKPGEHPRTHIRAALDSSWARQSSFAADVLRPPSPQLLHQGIEQLTAFWLERTVLGNDHPEFGYWVQLVDRLAGIRKVYGDILGLEAEFRQAGSAAGPDAFAGAVKSYVEKTKDLKEIGNLTFPADPGTLVLAYNDFARFLNESAGKVPSENDQILRLATLKDRLGSRWKAEFARVEGALRGWPADRPGTKLAEVTGWLQQGRTRLDQALDASLDALRQKLNLPADKDLLDYLIAQGLVEANEAKPGASFKGPVTVKLGPSPLGPDAVIVGYLREMEALTAGAAELLKRLDDLNQWAGLLKELESQQSIGGALGVWLAKVSKELEGAPSASTAKREEFITRYSLLTDRDFWQPVKLFQLADAIVQAHRAHSTDVLLAAMKQKCETVARSPTLAGLAQLMPGYDKPSPDRLPFVACATRAEPPKSKEPTREEPPQDDSDWRRRRRETPAEPAPPSGEARARTEEHPPLVAYHTRDVLTSTLRAYAATRAGLDKLGEHARPVSAALDQAADVYIDRYFTDWNALYHNYCELLDPETLTFLRKCQQRECDWPTFVQLLDKIGRDMPDLLARRLTAIVRELVLYDEPLARDASAEVLLNRVAERRRKLGAQDLAGYLDDLGQRASKLGKSADPAKELGDALADAWQSYLRQISALGVDPKGASAPPGWESLQKALEDALRPRRLKLDEDGLTAPLLSLARYGDQLLAHHLKGRLTSLLPSDGAYPFVADASDSDANLTRLGQLGSSALPADRLLKSLRDVDRFQQDYGKLLPALQRDPQAGEYLRALDECAAWVTFLYGPDRSRIAQPQAPAPLKVKCAISPREGTEYAGGSYNKVTVVVPLLNEAGDAPATIELEATTSGGRSIAPNALEALGKSDWKFRWSLFKEASFGRPFVTVSSRNETATAFPESLSTKWDLPESPWSLLLLIGASPDNRVGDERLNWRFPVLLRHGDRTIGLDIAIGFERPFPGPIKPIADPGKPPAMTAAEKFLTAPAAAPPKP